MARMAVIALSFMVGPLKDLKVGVLRRVAEKRFVFASCRAGSPYQISAK